MEPDIKTFNVLEALRGKTYPEDEVIVYDAPVALYEYARVDAEANAESDGERVNSLDARLAELRAEITASALKFKMRGYSPRLSREIMKQTRSQFKLSDTEDIKNNDEAWRWMNLKTVAESLLSVEKVATGEVDARRFSVEDVDALLSDLEPSEFYKVTGKAFELSFQALMYDSAVTPDFS